MTRARVSRGVTELCRHHHLWQMMSATTRAASSCDMSKLQDMYARTAASKGLLLLAPGRAAAAKTSATIRGRLFPAVGEWVFSASRVAIALVAFASVRFVLMIFSPSFQRADRIRV